MLGESYADIDENQQAQHRSLCCLVCVLEVAMKVAVDAPRST